MTTERTLDHQPTSESFELISGRNTRIGFTRDRKFAAELAKSLPGTMVRNPAGELWEWTGKGWRRRIA